MGSVAGGGSPATVTATATSAPARYLVAAGGSNGATHACQDGPQRYVSTSLATEETRSLHRTLRLVLNRRFNPLLFLPLPDVGEADPSSVNDRFIIAALVRSRVGLDADSSNLIACVRISSCSTPLSRPRIVADDSDAVRPLG